MKTARQYLLAALLYVREKPVSALMCTATCNALAQNVTTKLLKHYIAQWPVVLEEAKTDWQSLSFGTLWANPLRHELLNV